MLKCILKCVAFLMEAKVFAGVMYMKLWIMFLIFLWKTFKGVRVRKFSRPTSLYKKTIYMTVVFIGCSWKILSKVSLTIPQLGNLNLYCLWGLILASDIINLVSLKASILKLIFSKVSIFSSISKSWGNQMMKFGQLIEYNRNIFLGKSYTKCRGEAIPRPFSKKPK